MERELEDCLNCVTADTFPKGAHIFEGPSVDLYMVVEGRVALYRTPLEKQRRNNNKLLLDLYGEGEFFGEACFSPDNSHYCAVAMTETAKVMSWDRQQVLDREGILPALVDFIAQRHRVAIARIETMHANGVGHRVLPALIHFARKFGTETAECYTMKAMTQEVIANYVGTSREIVTHYCNLLRRNGALRYSRKEIVILKPAKREQAAA